MDQQTDGKLGEDDYSTPPNTSNGLFHLPLDTKMTATLQMITLSALSSMEIG